MSIDWINFTPYRSFLGGAMIGLATVTLLWFNGRIAGISGIVGGILARGESGRAWRVIFLLGLLASPWLYRIFAAAPLARVTGSWPLLVAGGLLVGMGTRYGGGCTSGHGVCGVARLSHRSLVATGIFMCTGFMTVYACRHVFSGGW